MLYKMILAYLATFCLATAQAALLKPRKDPFYKQPSTIRAYNPGDIIRSRKTPGPIGAAQKYFAAKVRSSYQILYRTTNALGKPVAAMCTIIIPHNPRFDKVLAYQTAYDSSDPNCSPSYTLQQKSNETSYDPIFMAAGLDKGYIISTSDYEGLEAQFVSGLMSGQATLDSIRATLQSTAITGVLSNATYSLWGYSGGALASEWAVELQPLYAPELHIAGAALGGLTPNVTNVIASTNNTMFSWQSFAGINGIAKAYPNISSYVSTQLIPSKAAEFHSINYLCTNDTSSENNLSNKDVATYFQNGTAALDNPIPQSVITWGATMGKRSTPSTPIFAYKAVGDEISPVADTDALVAKYCSNGASIQYSRNLFGEHVSEAILGSGAAFGFLTSVMEGMPVPTGCSTSTVLISNLGADAVLGFGAELVGVLKLLLMRPLGPDSIRGL